MSRVLFENERPALEVDPGRADVACFVGLVRRQIGAAVPSSVQDWLQSQGWLNPNYARPLDQLADLPVPIENWAGFTTMFDSGGSAVSFGTDYLAAAVRSFFAQGGKRCYVVRMGDPVDPGDDASSRAGKLALLLPDSTYRPDDRRSWHGVGHLGGLPDVSFLALPDLPVLLASRPAPASVVTEVQATGPEQFVECGGLATNLTADPSITSPANATFQVGMLDSFNVIAVGTPPLSISQAGGLPAGITFTDNKDGTATLSGTPTSSALCDLAFTVTGSAGTVTQAFTLIVTGNLAAPRLTDDDYKGWAGTVSAILQYLASGAIKNQSSLREVQFVAALPLPQELAPGSAPSAILARDIHQVIETYMLERAEPPGGIVSGNVSSAFLQLGYPWLKTSGSYVLRESLEPPDGALIGLLARNALKRGTFTSATKIKPAEIYDLWPALPPQETRVSATPLTWGDNSPKPLIERLSLFGFRPDGIRLISDVTAYPGESYRPASVNRLVSVICRAARRLGEEIIFELNGENLWARLQGFLQELLTGLWSLNALEGKTARDAFSVRCDRSTMTQNDLDNGRLVAEVVFNAAATIELIRVTLALETSGASAQEIATSVAEVGA
jgi:hypothetical protein